MSDGATFLDYAMGAPATVAGAHLGLNAIGNILISKVGPDAVITTTQAIELIGGTALGGLLGLAVGVFAAEYLKSNIDEYGVLSGILVSMTDPFIKLPKAIGDTACKVSEKASQIAQAINAKAQQIADHIKTKVNNKDNDNTLSR